MSEANFKLLVLCATWLLGALVLISLTEAVSGWFFLPLLLLMITLGALSYRVRCHNCGWSLIKRRWGLVAPFAPKTCPNCGEEVR